MALNKVINCRKAWIDKDYRQLSIK